MLAEQRFWDKVDVRGTGQCWRWLGARDLGGYGRISIDGVQHPAHRIAFELSTGSPVAGKLIGACQANRDCCNPAHLLEVTRKTVAERRPGPQRNNSTSLVRGVYPARNGRWQAKLQHHGRSISVGVFDTIPEADEAVRLARRRLFTASFADRGVGIENGRPKIAVGGRSRVRWCDYTSGS